MRRRSVLIVVLAMAFVHSTASSDPRPVDTEWRSFGHDPGGMRYSTLKQIDLRNVARLARAWTYHHGETFAGMAGDRLPPFDCTPIVGDGWRMDARARNTA